MYQHMQLFFFLSHRNSNSNFFCAPNFETTVQVNMEKKNYQSKRAGYFLLLFFLAASFIQAQSKRVNTPVNSEEIKIVTDSLHGKLDIEFECMHPVNDLLILMTDSLGEPVFIECQRMYSGKYRHSVDLRKCPRGNYNVKVIRDNSRIDRKIVVK
jgi:hypothetical protein